MLERLRIKFRRKNVIIVTTRYIPLYVQFVASLGSKFSFHTCDEKDEKNGILNFLIGFERIKSQVSDFFGMNQLEKERRKFVRKHRDSSLRNRSNPATRAQIFIKLQMKRTRIFLNDNKQIRIFSADKGGRIIITDRETYADKMRSHIDLNVKNQNYVYCDGLTFEYVRSLCEAKYEGTRLTFSSRRMPS